MTYIHQPRGTLDADLIVVQAAATAAAHAIVVPAEHLPAWNAYCAVTHAVHAEQTRRNDVRDDLATALADLLIETGGAS